MAVDLSVFSRQKSLLDQQAELQQAFLAKKLAVAQLAQKASGTDLPAPLQLANEYQKRIAAGDVKGANLIMQFAKTQDKGLQVGIDPTSGQQVYTPLAGYAPAVASIEGAKSGAKEQAQKDVDKVMDPIIEGGKQDAKNASDTNAIAPKEVAKAQGEAQVGAANLAGQLPNLYKVTDALSDLGKKATYTTAGQLYDSAVRQTGGFGGLTDPQTPGAVARTAYISKVDNEVLPLLRQTFGAQFTEREGNSLKVTLGDPDKTPAEKDAVLKSFIQQKVAQIGTMQNQAANLGNINGTNKPVVNVSGTDVKNYNHLWK